MSHHVSIDPPDLGGRPLPSPKGVAMAIMQACQREDTTVASIAALVQTDPSLTGRLLQRANAAAVSGRAILAISDAVGRLGLQSVRHLALSFSLIDQYNSGQCAEFNYSGFWSHSLLMAVAAQELGKVLRLGASDEMFTCGLLSRVGLLALATAYPTEFSEILKKSLDGVELICAEQQLLRTNHLQMSGVLLGQWGVPEIFVDAVLNHEDPVNAPLIEGSRLWQLSRVLHLAKQLADFLVSPTEESAYVMPKLVLMSGQMGIAVSEFETCVDTIVVNWNDYGHQLSIQSHQVAPFSKLVQIQVRPDQATNLDWLRVLIVEDDPIVSDLLEAWLRDECRYTVMTARNGQEALAVAMDYQPHVVISDWLMPVMDGLELCTALRSSAWGENIYVLMLTSVSEENELYRAFDAGVDDYLVKPVNLRALSARLKAAWRYVRLRDAWERDHSRLTTAAAELALTNRRLQEAALSDPLTGLANRRAGLTVLSQAWSASVRYGHLLSVIMIDIDHFKLINDTHGHAAGDLVLQQLSQCFRTTARKEDSVCRWGGEEFLMICPNVGALECVRMAERLRRLVEQIHINNEGKVIQVTISAGVASWSVQSKHVEQMLGQADKALYEAKDGGRNRTVNFLAE
ncbi:MAG TPA: diguanylate cyclase [Rhodoferax sp.]|jgi:two-component system cell cycle response regulator|nr:diguanylate cyclase [Rhodoferax sp.]